MAHPCFNFATAIKLAMEDLSIFAREWWCSAFYLPRHTSIEAAWKAVSTSLSAGLGLKISTKPSRSKALIFEAFNEESVKGEEGKWEGVSKIGFIQDLRAFSPLGQELILDELNVDSLEQVVRDYPRVVSRTRDGAILAHPIFVGILKLGKGKFVAVVSAPYLRLEGLVRQTLLSSGAHYVRIGVNVRRLFRAVADSSFQDKDFYFCAGRLIVEGVTSLRSATFTGQDVVRNWLYEYLTSPEIVKRGVVVSPKDCKVRRTFGPTWTLSDKRALFVWFNEIGAFRLKPGTENGANFIKLFELIYLLDDFGFFEKSGNKYI